MKNFLAVVLVLCCAGVAEAQKFGTVKDECRSVLEKNFKACEDKDLRALMSTISKRVGTRAQGLEFAGEAQKMFDETSVLMKLEKFELLNFSPPEATFLVRQSTRPNNEEDHKPKKPGLNFRHHSALLPEWQEVEYQQKFWYEGGKWRVHLVITKPEPVAGTLPFMAERSEDDDSLAGVLDGAPAEVKNDCPDGRCNWPFVRVK